MLKDTKAAGKLLILAIATEAVILTDALAVAIAGLITSDVVIKGVISFSLIYLLWISGILIIRAYYKKHEELHLHYAEIPGAKNILAGLLLLAISIVISYLNWSGFKLYIEFTGSVKAFGLGLGIASFAAQYIYYFIEAILITMIIVFSQEAGEALFKLRWIPYGGIALAILWGLAHIVWHGAADGLMSTLNAVLYGVATLIMKKSNKLTFILVFLMFIL